MQQSLDATLLSETGVISATGRLQEGKFRIM